MNFDIDLYLDGNEDLHSSAGDSKTGTIDHGGRCYHLTQQTWCREPVFNRDIAAFRHNMLCRLCVKFNVVILFSVTMPNHTHDILFSKNWKDIADVARHLNSAVSKYVYSKDPKRKELGKPVFNSRPTYSIVTSINYLFFLGKYLLWNVEQMESEGRFVPYSCFWMFEKEHFSEPYRKDIYKDLFGFEPKDLLTFYKSNTKTQVLANAKELFADWTNEENIALFRVELPPKPSPRRST